MEFHSQQQQQLLGSEFQQWGSGQQQQQQYKSRSLCQEMSKIFLEQTLFDVVGFDNPKDLESTISLYELFEAYFECRKNKRNTANALAFEIDYETQLVKLLDEINRKTYEIGRSISFIVDKPVKREIFAADFRDRIIHHLVIKKLNPLFENEFIYDSYNCRVGRGTHFGIKRVEKFIRRCSQNYAKDCYILKLDLQGFFMSIDKVILWDKLERFIREKYYAQDKDLILHLCKQIIFNNPVENCIIRGKRSNWNDLPKSKSLFHSKADCGLPIGNLTSQIFANFYLNSFDHFIKHDLGIKYYGRYVDDFVIVHENKNYLKSIISQISDFLQSKLHLSLHPRKIYLQHFSKGVKFTGAVILPNRVYIANRTKGNFYIAIEKYNNVVRGRRITRKAQLKFQCSMNSYLGIIKHYKSYTIRKKMIRNNIGAKWFNYVYVSGGYGKLVLKNRIIRRKRGIF